MERADGRPLYQQVRQALLELLASGDYEPGTRFLTEREVCERFGVSTTTAVRALNDLVAAGALIRRQGSGTFVSEPSPKSAAPRGNGARRERSIACIVHSHDGNVAQVVRGLQPELTELGYRMYLSYVDGSAAGESRALREAIEENVAGIVLYPAENGAPTEVFTEVRARGIPLVTVDRYRPDVVSDAVVADNLAIGYRVTRALIELGHERIAPLWQEINCTSVSDRLAGHIQALRDHGLPVRPELTVLRRFQPKRPGRPGLVETLLSGSQPPTVLLCGNGFALAQAAEELVELGHEVPGAVDLAGMDDVGPFDVFPLTVVAATVPAYDIGREAARLLHRRIESGDPYSDVQQITLPISIRTRESAPGHLRVVVGSDRSVSESELSAEDR